MKKYSSPLDYSKIAALICDGEKKVGSGFFLWSDDESSLYCVTAKHNLDENDNPTIRILGEDNSFSKVISFHGCYSHQTEDVSVFDVVIDSCTENIPNTWLYRFDTDPKEVTLNGFPQNCTIDLVQSSARCHVKHENALLLEIDSLSTDPLERLDEVVGFSGGACYAEVNGSLLFVGMMFHCLDKNVPFKELAAVTINPIIELLDTHKLPSLAPHCPNYWLEKDKHFKKIEDVLKNQTFANCFADCLSVVSIINQKISEFYNTIEPVLHFGGSSGIGKTRSVLERCKLIPYCIYYEKIDDFYKDIAWLTNYHDVVNMLYVIVDEVKLDIFQQLKNIKYTLSEHVKLILIGTFSQKQRYLSKSIIFLDDLNQNDVIQVLQKEYHEASIEELTEIQQLCYFDLRLSILISGLYFSEQSETNKQSLIPLSKRSISDLEQTASIDATLRKTLAAHDSTKPYDLDARQYVYHLSTFVDIRFREEDTLFSELRTMTSFFAKSDSCYESDLRLAIDYLADINLGIKRSDYFELSPRVLAKMAFEQQGWDLVKYRLGEFLELLANDSRPNDLMRKRFFQRVIECDKLDELKELVKPWLENKLYHTSLTDLTYSDTTTYMQYVEYFPVVGLAWLKREIYGDRVPPTVENLPNRLRQSIVHTCSHLANFKEWFYLSEEILFRLALNETDSFVSNNSQGTWCDLFSPILANTEVCFSDRATLLLKRSIDDTHEFHSDLFNQVFKTAIHVYEGTKLVPPDEVGGLMTPESWVPDTLWDMRQTLVIFMEKVAQNLAYFSPEMKLCLLTAVQERMIGYYYYQLLPELKEFLDSFNLTQDEKSFFLAKLENFNVYHTENKDGNTFITAWTLEWTDVTLEGRLKKFLVTPDQMHSFKEDIAQKYKEDLQSLVHEVLNYSWPTNVFEDIIFEPRDNNYPSRLLGETLGHEDVSLIFLPKIENIKEMGACPFLNGYFTGVYERHQKLPKPLSDLLNGSNAYNENFVIWATTCFQITTAGYQKLLYLTRTSAHIHYIANLEIGDCRKFLSESEKIEILTTILTTQHSDKYKVFFTVASSWIQEGTSFSKLFLLYLTALDNCSGEYQAFIVTKTLKYFPPEYQETILKLLCRDFRFDDFYNENNCYILEYLKRIDDCENNSLMMEYLGNAMIEQSKKHPFFSPHKGIFDMFQTKVVLDWIDVAPRERAPLIAFHLSTPTETFPEIPTLTQEVSSKYFFSEVSNEFRRGFSFGVYCVDSLYAQKDKLLEFYQQYVNSEVILIREWAEYKIGHLKWECQNHEESTAKRQRYE